MIDYIYDGSFEGLLTCVYNHYYIDRAERICVRGEYQPSMLNDSMDVETDSAKAARVYCAIESKISSYALRSVYRAFLSNDSEKEMKILRYLVLGFRNSYAAGHYRSDPAVFDIESLVKKVGLEKERMLEFVRFQVMDWRDDSSYAGLVDDGDSSDFRQILYAEVEPDNDVLELVGEHFSDRFKSEPLIIRDLVRNKALIAYEGHWYISDGLPAELKCGTEGELDLIKSDSEISYQHLWQTYFDHIAIKERTNPRCQRNHMPERYWKHLTEINRTK